MQNDRSSRREVRNPVLALPSATRLQNLPPEAAASLESCLREMSTEANERAQEEECWKKHKAPMAAYWKACSVYYRHIARVIAIGRRRIAASVDTSETMANAA